MHPSCSIKTSDRKAVEELKEMAMAAKMAMGIRPTSGMLLTSYKPRWAFAPLAVSSSSSTPPPPPPPPRKARRKLILYSKPECCLCDGLKEKLQAAFLLSGPDSLNDVDLEIRDITTNPFWRKSYQYEIPVLAKVLSDGTEETLPRLSPRLGVELVHKKIAEALKELD